MTRSGGSEGGVDATSGGTQGEHRHRHRQRRHPPAIPPSRFLLPHDPLQLMRQGVPLKKALGTLPVLSPRRWPHDFW